MSYKRILENMESTVKERAKDLKPRLQDYQFKDNEVHKTDESLSPKYSDVPNEQYDIAKSEYAANAVGAALSKMIMLKQPQVKEILNQED